MIFALATLATACGGPPPAPSVAVPASEGRRVLVVANASDPDSVRLARYYAEKRSVPKENVVLLQTPAVEEVAASVYGHDIAGPVQGALAKTKNPVDFLLFVRGVPIRVKEGGYSVDSLLMGPNVQTQKLTVGDKTFDVAPNPYFNKAEPFTHARFGLYLACRLDGYTAADARALVDRALAARPNKGPFLLNKARNRNAESYGEMQATLVHAADVLKTKGFDAKLDEGAAFAASPAPLAGYASWGSNDAAFNLGVYRGLKFLPGAVCETFVSTSGRTFRPTTGGQSLIADLVAQGVTGVKGYVSEPYTLALAKADVLFDRYTSGRNLAESFYAASPVVHWKDVVIGDPLCAPYAK